MNAPRVYLDTTNPGSPFTFRYRAESYTGDVRRSFATLGEAVAWIETGLVIDVTDGALYRVSIIDGEQVTEIVRSSIVARG